MYINNEIDIQHMTLDISCIIDFAIVNLTMKSIHQLGGELCYIHYNEFDQVIDPVFCLQILLMDDLTMSEVNDWHSRLTPLALLFIEGNGCSAWFSCKLLKPIR